MFLQELFGEELTDTLCSYNVDYVHLVTKLFRCLLMALEPLHPPLEPDLPFAAAVAEALEYARPDVLVIGVEVFAAFSHSAHHPSLCLVLVCRQDLLIMLTTTR